MGGRAGLDAPAPAAGSPARRGAVPFRQTSYPHSALTGGRRDRPTRRGARERRAGLDRPSGGRPPGHAARGRAAGAWGARGGCRSGAWRSCSGAVSNPASATWEVSGSLAVGRDEGAEDCGGGAWAPGGAPPVEDLQGCGPRTPSRPGVVAGGGGRGRRSGRAVPFGRVVRGGRAGRVRDHAKGRGHGGPGPGGAPWSAFGFALSSWSGRLLEGASKDARGSLPPGSWNASPSRVGRVGPRDVRAVLDQDSGAVPSNRDHVLAPGGPWAGARDRQA